jgi:hypothetical protein
VDIAKKFQLGRLLGNSGRRRLWFERAEQNWGIDVRGFVYLAAAALGLIVFAQTATAVTVWQGEAVITTASGTCTFPGDDRSNIGTGTVLKSVFRPRLVDNNGANTRISFMHDSGAMFMMVLQDTGANGDYARIGITHSALLINSGLASFASYQQSPTTVTASTTFVRVSGHVEDFMLLSGCDATFRASYSKR